MHGENSEEVRFALRSNLAIAAIIGIQLELTIAHRRKCLAYEYNTARFRKTNVHMYKCYVARVGTLGPYGYICRTEQKFPHCAKT